MHRFSLSILLLFALTNLQAQTVGGTTSFEITNDIKVIDSNGKELKLAGIGGLNQPQFYNLDIDNDGTLDLYVFDRTGGKSISLINDGTGNFSYHPEYDQIYPGRFTTWVVFKDYNNDDLADLWFYNEDIDAISLYRNITKANDPHVRFELADSELNAYNFNTPPLDSNDLYCDRTNIPAIEDVDGDGDVDFMTLQTLGYGITLFLNNTVERGEPLDPPQFEIADECWGDFQEYDGSNQIDFSRDQFCFHKFYRHLKKKHAGGSSLLLIDMDKDADMDLVMGNAGLDNLNLLINGKSDHGQSIDTMIASDSLFPSNTRQAAMNAFPAGFYQDVDADGVKDLIVAVNMFDKRSYFYRETENIFYYKNKGENDKPDFEIQDTLFITGETVDQGGYSAPVLWDMDADGDLDLILATNGDWGITEELADFLILYENIGTKDVPVFEEAVFDYLGLRKDSIRQLSPCLGDLNRDGSPELLVGRLNGTLSLYNIIGSGKTATASKVSDNTYSINVTEASSPYLADVDGDGYIDLLVGARDGKTRYYRNTSTSDVPAFSKLKDTFGNVLSGDWIVELQYNPHTNEFYDSTVFRPLTYSSPVIADLDSDGDPEYIFGDVRGNLTIYSDIRKAGAGIDSFRLIEEDPFFISEFNQCYNYNFGTQAKTAVGDINNDGKPDLIVGDNRGGFQIALASGQCNVGVSEITRKKSELEFYPNPTTGLVNLPGLNGNKASLKVTNVNGQQVYSQQVAANAALDLSFLPEGVYILQLITNEENRVGKLIKVDQ
ncbi:MAG: T9SS type A sorting domain-containing protein [Bacteroidia bacterium]|nr:T9SS type A sorting domain-containing protein [Bacteroidia bacterium]